MSEEYLICREVGRLGW